MAAIEHDAGTALGPYFRRYELPWSPSEEMDRRFRVIRLALIIVFVLLAVVVTLLPKQAQVFNTDSLPERVVKLVVEPPPPPPPPPKPLPKPEPKPEPKSAEKSPTPTPKAPVDPRVKAAQSGLLAHMDDLAALRDVDVDKFAKDQARTNDPGDVSTISRSMITSKVGGTSGGIAAPTSSGLAAGGGSLNAIRTAQIKDPTLAAAHSATRAGGSGKGSRSADEVALVFDRNKGSIYALYTRALRDNPALQGKVVVEVTIAPSGEVTGVKVVSTELNDPDFEAKLLARVRLYKFDAEDVAALTATREIDFFPAG